MTVKLLCVGKLKETYWKDAVAEYAKRLSRFFKLELIEVPDAPGGDQPSAAQTVQLLEREGEQILRHIRPGDYLLGMCIEGKPLSSEQLAHKLAGLMVDGRSDLCFLIGGSWGLADAVKARCDARISMGPMTFPHQLARVMLLEQIYRAFKINAGENYHK